MHWSLLHSVRLPSRVWSAISEFVSDFCSFARACVPRTMPNIRFSFDQDKLTAVLTFFASRVDDLDALKSAKLLYFADKRHLLRYGRPILGDNYFGMDHGPVPERAYDQIKAALDRKHSVVPPHFAQ